MGCGYPVEYRPGVPGERVTLRAYDTLTSALLPPVEATIGPEGTASLHLTRP